MLKTDSNIRFKLVGNTKLIHIVNRLHGMENDDFKYKPVDSKTWNDFENFFEGKGCPSYCWCMVWRNMYEGKDRSKNDDKKISLKNYVDSRIPVGLLCYTEKEPIAWCSIAPRESYRNLSGDDSLKDVWSLVCFFIKREYRHQGMSEKLITAALKYAKENKAKYVEAYPVDIDSPSYRFMGFKQTFENMGFTFKNKIGQRRNLMVIKL